MSRLLFLFGRFIGIFINTDALNYLKKYSFIFYSGLVKSCLKCGKRFYCEYPLTIYGRKYIEIGDNFYLYGRARIEIFDNIKGVNFKPKLLIGSNVSIIYDCHIACVNEISIGNNVLIASRVFITDHYHGRINKETAVIPPSLREIYSKGSINIEDDVWIGEGACIMPNVTIGRGSIVGANSVVTNSFPEYSVIGGVPARLIRSL